MTKHDDAIHPAEATPPAQATAAPTDLSAAIMALPTLPGPCNQTFYAGGASHFHKLNPGTPYYTAEQMREYGTDCVRASQPNTVPLTYTVDGEVMTPLEYIDYLHGQINTLGNVMHVSTEAMRKVDAIEALKAKYGEQPSAVPQAAAVVGTQKRSGTWVAVLGANPQWLEMSDHKTIIPLKDMPEGALLYESAVPQAVAVPEDTAKDAARFLYLIDQLPCSIADDLECGISEIAETIDQQIVNLALSRDDFLAATPTTPSGDA